MSHLDRRSFLTLHRRKAAPKSAKPESQTIAEIPEGIRLRLEARAAMPPNSGLAPYTGPWDQEAVIHLLRRTMFGVTKADINYFQGMTMTEAVDALLNAPYSPPPPPVNDYNNPDYTDPDVPFGTTFVNAPFNIEAEGLRTESVRGWWLRQMMQGDRSIREKMLLFWHNHIPVIFPEVFSGPILYRYVNTLRENSLGNVKDLVKKMTIDPAMLIFLNGYVNSKDAPDENYAREIQELFVVGKDLPQHFTEDDVKAAARLLTGWRINIFDYSVYFDYWDHDTADKQFSAFYNNTFIQGQSGPGSGEAELDAFLDMMLAHPEPARFICRKLYRFFVFHAIDAQTEQNIIEPLAQIFRDNNYNILPVLDALFKSEHFFDQLNRGAMIKSPIDLGVGFFRQMQVTFPGSADLLDTLYLSYITNLLLYEMLQMPGDPPNVAGWQAYYQLPVFDKIWINTTTLPKRGKFTEAMLFVGLYAVNNAATVNVLDYAAGLSDPGDPNVVVAETHALFFGLPVSPIVTAYHKAILLTGLPSDYYWTSAWVNYTNNPNDPIARGEVENRLKFLLHVVCQTEEHQLM